MSAGNKFNAFAAAMPNGGVNLASDALKVMLTNTLPLALNTQYSDISVNELASGNGYTTGGAAVTTVSSIQSSGVYKYTGSAANPTWTASGSMGPFRYAVLYDTTSTIKSLIGWWDYGSNLTLSAAGTFTLLFDATNGIFQLA
jgi:hypothetical protein